jgi:hypothetical protein
LALVASMSVVASRATPEDDKLDSRLLNIELCNGQKQKTPESQI